MKIEFDHQDVTDMLNKVGAKMADMTEVHQALGEYFIKDTKDRFVEGKDPDGNAWAPKSQTTIERYIRNGDRADPRPLFGPSGALSTQITYSASPNQLQWGSNLIYAAVMQMGASKGQFGTMSNGSSIPFGNIPARPFLGISDENRDVMLEVIGEFLTSAD